MFKKFICVLLIVLLAVCSMGSACATHYYGDCGVELGDVFDERDCYSMVPNDNFNQGCVLGAVEESGLCKELEKPTADFYGFMHWKHSAEKIGSYKYTVVPFWGGDDDYLTFHVNPHPTKIVMDYAPFTDNNHILSGMVYIKASNPDKTHPGDYEFKKTPMSFICINLCDPTECHYANVNSTSYGFWELCEFKWNLKPGDKYILGVNSEPKGNWSGASYNTTFIA